MIVADFRSNTNIDMVKADVEPFILNKKELEIWSNEYFLMLADKIKVSDN